jgi:hypothetical protein
MPLLRGIARTAVIAGTATHVSNNVSRRQEARWQQQAAQEAAPPQPAQAAPAAAPEADPVERLKELAALRDQGVLTDEEFASQKAKILGTMG